MRHDRQNRNEGGQAAAADRAAAVEKADAGRRWFSPITTKEERAMSDDLQPLRGDRELVELLAHYAELAAPDREAWQDRVMELEGVEARQLARLHGALIATGWVEQNTGVTPAATRKVGAGCYRVTGAGLKALKRARLECAAGAGE
jgi:hypothetical protein